MLKMICTRSLVLIKRLLKGKDFMALRDEIKEDPRAMEMPLVFLEMVQNFSTEQWNRLLGALKKGDKASAAGLFGMTTEEADRQFKLIKERAEEVFQKHPDILDLTKGR